jgi:ABC-2 type transport system permease protein
MNTRIIRAIATKDLLEVRQNKAAWIPMLVVPLIFVILFPMAMIWIPTQFDIPIDSMTNDSDLETFLQNMPAGMMQQLEGLDEFQGMVVMVLGMMFAPMFLMFPLMFSTIIAAESFAGERERKTMESLLYTPATDKELFFGKVMAGFVPALIISWGSFIVYTIVVNVLGWPVFGRIWFPLDTWYPLILWISPALALLGVSFTVLISSKTPTFMGAYQSSSALVILVVALMIGQVSGVVYLNVGVGMLVGLFCWLIAITLTVIAIKNFNRSKLLTSTGS